MTSNEPVCSPSLRLQFGPNPHLAVVVDLNMNDVRSAAGRAIFDPVATPPG